MFATCGSTLITNGYRILPIYPRAKNPMVNEWEAANLSINDHARMAANGYAQAGLGVMTGQPGLDGVVVTLADIDTTSAWLAEQMRDWFDAHVGLTVERVGMAPKLGLVYQAEPNLAKCSSAIFFDPGHEGEKPHKHQLEWLNRGQQFVAYGIHPDTGRPYQQDGLLGTLEDIPARLLPMVTLDIMAQAIAHFEHLAEGMGLVRATSGQRGPMQAGTEDQALVAALQAVDPPLDISTEELATKLGALDPDDYDLWVRTGMAIHRQYAGSDEGLDLWDTWSQESGKYQGRAEVQAKWRSFSDPNESGRPAVTLRSILKQANEVIRERAVEQQVEATTSSIGAAAQYKQQLTDAADEETVRTTVCGAIRKDASLTDVDREQLANAVQVAMKRITGTKLPIPLARTMVVLERTRGGWPDTDEEGTPRRTWRNVARVLAQSGCTVRYNVVTKEQDVLITGLHLSPDNAADSSAGWIVSRCEEMGLNIDPSRVRTFIKLIADQQQYSPVTTWVRSKPWDGVSRLQALYDTVESPMDADPAQKTLKELMVRKWMIYAVGAAFSQEGMAGRGVLTFTGEQYIGKTRWLRALVPAETPGMFLEGHLLDPRSKDSVKAAISHWLVELGELDATFKKADIAALKSFLTLKTDTLRLPYAVGDSKFPRRTAFCASVNADTFLADETGNTRFWAISVTKLNHEHGLDMQQVWAEVLEAWKSGEQHWLDACDMVEVSDHAAQHAEVNPITEMLADGLDWKAPVESWTWRSATQIAQLVHLPRIGVSEVSTVGRYIVKRNGGKRSVSKNSRRLLCPPVVGMESFDKVG